jgi:rhamnosyltransferase subunit B
MARVVLLPFGSAGDVFPFVAIGRRLRARGDEVVLITASQFEEAVTGAGLEFRPLAGSEHFEALVRDPRIWKPGIGTKLVLETACRAIDPFVAAVEGWMAERGRPDLMLASLTAMGGRMVREKHGIPTLTVHLQPAAILSAHQTPILAPGMKLFRRLPVWLKRRLMDAGNPVDLFCGRLVREACARHGVRPPQSVMKEWWDSPEGVLALFPEWFAAPQPDWPQPVQQTDFPLEDLATEMSLSSELEAFLDDGSSPVVFTAGSANVQAEKFFRIATQALAASGLRGVLVSRELEQLPVELPSSVLPVTYAPFSSLLKRASAFVHHGGIGTVSQAFAAGVPQLVVPMAHDQPDNADRLERLGAGLSLPSWFLSASRLARRLKRLQDDREIRDRCTDLATRLRASGGLPGVLEFIDQTISEGLSIRKRR